MSSLNNLTYNFFNSIILNSYELSIEFKIVIVSILLIIIYYVFYLVKKYTLIRKRYIYSIFIFLLVNLVSIIGINYLYIVYKGSFVGEVGLKGDTGHKGGEGNNLSCRICNYNIYMQKTARYDYKLTFNKDILKIQYGDNFNIFGLMDKFNETPINIDRVLKSFYNNKLSGMMENINNLLNIPDVLLYYDILYNLIDNDKAYKIVTPSQKRGYTPISDMFVTDDYKGLSNVFNGDIRYPRNVKKITSIYIKDEKSNKPLIYDIYKLKAPKHYMSLGHIFNRVGNKFNKNMYVCLSKDCVKLASVQELKLKYMYPDINGNYISIWISVFNTLYIKNASLDNFKNNHALIEELYDYDDKIYYTSGNIKREIYSKLDNFLANININSLTAFLYIVKNTHSMILLNLDYIYENSKDIVNLNMIRNTDNIKLHQLDNYLSRVKNILTTKLNSYQKNIKLGTPINELLSDGDEKYHIISTLENFIKLITSLESEMKSMPSIINSIQTLKDLVDSIFINGLLTKLDNKKLNDTQKKLIILIKSLIPPDKKVYIPKNTCLTYEHIDEDRLTVINNIEINIDKYLRLLEDLNNGVVIYESDRLSEFNKEHEIIKFNLNNNLQNIPDYYSKIMAKDFKEFTLSQLESLNNDFNKLLNI